MIRTITVGSCISIQGMFERELGNGHIVVRVGVNGGVKPSHWAAQKSATLARG